MDELLGGDIEMIALPRFFRQIFDKIPNIFPKIIKQGAILFLI